MPRYTVWYDEVRTNKVWFDADSKEHAETLIRQLNSGEISEPPNAGEKCKNVSIAYALDTLQAVEEND